MCEINTANDQLVGMQGENIIVVMPKTVMTSEDAKRHAAYLVVLAEGLGGTGPSFEEILEAVKNT